MSVTERKDSVRDEAERYRTAAEETLNQLGWCVEYLRRIRKPKLAAALNRNRSEIERRMHEPR